MSGLQSPYGQDLDLLSSPTRLNISSINAYETPLKPAKTSTTSLTPDGFPELSSQLDQTTQKLSTIYRTIGYTSQEIKQHERQLIQRITMSFKKFLDDASQFQTELQQINNDSIDCIRSILKTIGDPSGIRTIPDLYMRNIIVKAQKPEGTLLNTQKFIKITKDPIIHEYKTKLLKYLDQLFILAKLAETVHDFKSMDHDSLMIRVPLPEDVDELRNAFHSNESLDSLFTYIVVVFKEKLNVTPFLDLSEEGFKKLQFTIKAYEKETLSRKELTKSLSNQIVTMWRELGEKDQVDREVYNNVIKYRDGKSQVALLKLNIEELTNILSDLEKLKNSRIKDKMKYEDICENLWTKLNEDTSYVKQFKATNFSLTLECLENYQVEHERLLELKKGYTKEFIVDAKLEILKLWDTLNYSEDKRNEFTNFHETTNLDDNLLNSLECYILNLKEEYLRFKPLLNLTSEFKNLLLDREKLEESTKDSSRLIKKNSHKILMEEERLRKRLSRQMPKVVSDIKSKIVEMQQAGLQFTMINNELLAKINEEYFKLEKKGRIMPQSTTRNSTSRPSTRSTTRNSSRNTSAIPSRTSSPIRQINTTGTAAFKISHGIQKPCQNLRKPISPTVLLNHPKSTNISTNRLSKSISPQRRRTDQAHLISLLNTPSPLYRSQSTLQPSRIHQDQDVPTLLRQNSESATPSLRISNRSKIPIPSTSLQKHTQPNNTSYKEIFTSPLRSLENDQSKRDHLSIKEEDQENLNVSMVMSDFGGEEEDKYSNWRKEQLAKLHNRQNSITYD